MLETRTRFPGQIDQPEPPEQKPPVTRPGISTAAHLRASLRMYQARRGREGATAGSRLAAALPIVRGTATKEKTCPTSVGRALVAKVTRHGDDLYSFVHVRDDFQSYAVKPAECVAHLFADSVEIITDLRGTASQTNMDTASTFKLGVFPYTDDPSNVNGNGVNGPCWTSNLAARTSLRPALTRSLLPAHDRSKPAATCDPAPTEGSDARRGQQPGGHDGRRPRATGRRATHSTPRSLWARRPPSADARRHPRRRVRTARYPGSPRRDPPTR